MSVLVYSWRLLTSDLVHLIIISILVKAWILADLRPQSAVDRHLVPFISDMVLTSLHRVQRLILVSHQIRPQLIPIHSVCIGVLLKRVRFVRCEHGPQGLFLAIIGIPF